MTRKKPNLELIGKKYGQLTVVEFSHFSDTGHPYWLCKCDCGNEKVICEYNFTENRTKSCGCRRKARGKTLRTDILTIYEGVSVEKAKSKTLQKNNKSGFRGVSLNAKSGKYRVSVSFKGKRYHLGYYTDFEEAVEARIAGEEIVDEFIKDYYTKSNNLTAISELINNRLFSTEKTQENFCKKVCKDRKFSIITGQVTIVGSINTQENLIVNGIVESGIYSSQDILINGLVKGNVVVNGDIYLPNGEVLGKVQGNQIFCSNTTEQIKGIVVGCIYPYSLL